MRTGKSFVEGVDRQRFYGLYKQVTLSLAVERELPNRPALEVGGQQFFDGLGVRHRRARP